MQEQSEFNSVFETLNDGCIEWQPMVHPLTRLATMQNVIRSFALLYNPDEFGSVQLYYQY
jgi:hypothetical protein